MLAKNRTLTQSLLWLAALAGIVLALNLLVRFKPIRLDITEDSEFTLSPATEKILGGLKDRLTIQLYYSQNLPAQLGELEETVADTLEELKARSPETVLIERIVPDDNELQEQETQQLGIAPLQVNIIEKDKRELKKVYMGLVMLYQDRKEVISALTQTRNLEYELTLRLLKLTTDKLPRVGLWVPESARDHHQFLADVIKQMAEPVAVDATTLAKSQVTSLLLTAPQNFTKTDVAALDDFLMNGGNVLTFAGRIAISKNLSPEGVTTGLEDWLKNKGFTLTERLVLDPKQNESAAFQMGMLQAMVPYPFWVKVYEKDLNPTSPITAELEDVLFPWTNALEPAEAAPDWSSEALASTSSSAFLQQKDLPGVNPQYVEEMTDNPEFRIHQLAVKFHHKSRKDVGQLTWVANSAMIEDQFLQQAPSNLVFLENLIESASWGDELMSIRSRGKTSRPLAETSGQTKALLKWGFVIGTPLVLVLSGLVFQMILRTRRRKLIQEIV